MQPPPDSIDPGPPRRGFLKQFATGVLSAVVGIVPGLAGLLVVFDPVKRKQKSGAGEPLLVARIGSLPADGVPRRFQVLADRVDAWNTYRNIPVGAVYLRRTSDNKVTALNASCPHAGCSVGFSTEKGQFLCPCHDSFFSVEGQIATASSPSPRALDALDVEVRNDEEIWIRFRNFQPGHKEQIPVA
jgi:Rieske Fe-S protein